MDSLLSSYHKDKFRDVTDTPYEDLINGFSTILESGRTDLAKALYNKNQKKLSNDPNQVNEICNVSVQYHNCQFLQFIVEDKLDLLKNQEFKEQNPIIYDNIMYCYIINVIFPQQGKFKSLQMSQKQIQSKEIQQKVEKDIQQKQHNRQSKIERVRKLSVSTGQQEYISKGHTKEQHYKHEHNKKVLKQRTITLLFTLMILFALKKAQSKLVPQLWVKLFQVLKSAIGMN